MTDVPVFDPSERDLLLRYLRKMRGAVVRATDGLTDEQLRAPGVASGTNLLGLVHHLTGVEEHWFRRVFLGLDVPADKAMTVPPGLDAAEVLTRYRATWALTDEIVGSHQLTEIAAIPNPGEDARDTLRVILAHLVEETARHAGHADILREQIDGRTDD